MNYYTVCRTVQTKPGLLIVKQLFYDMEYNLEFTATSMKYTAHICTIPPCKVVGAGADLNTLSIKHDTKVSWTVWYLLLELVIDRRGSYSSAQLE